MNKEFEILREKLDIQKLKVQLNLSRMQQANSTYIILIVGVAFILYFRFGFEIFLIAFTIITFIYIISILPHKKRRNKAVLRAFAIGNLLHKKLDTDMIKLNKEIEDMERKIKDGNMTEV